VKKIRHKKNPEFWCNEFVEQNDVVVLSEGASVSLVDLVMSQKGSCIEEMENVKEYLRLKTLFSF
jgi:hypothetical protein